MLSGTGEGCRSSSNVGLSVLMFEETMLKNNKVNVFYLFSFLVGLETFGTTLVHYIGLAICQQLLQSVQKLARHREHFVLNICFKYLVSL